jgi:Family of unknown function (DUF6526)
MSEQNIKNHVRYYTPHHFVFYPVLLIAIIAALRYMNHCAGQRMLWMAIVFLLIMIGWLSFMMRQHYALGNQDRLIRLELRFRYYVLTRERFEPVEAKLHFRQIAALRFASDEELPALVARTLAENLSPKEIKKSVRHWMPDHMRV